MDSSYGTFLGLPRQFSDVSWIQEEECEEPRTISHSCHSRRRMNKNQNRASPLVKKLKKFKRIIASHSGKQKTDEEESRPGSSLSMNSTLGPARSSKLDVIDFIDDEYLALRRRVHLFHHHLRKIHDHLEGSLKAGPPIGGRLDALKSTFKVGTLSEFPETSLAKAFEDFNRTLRYDGKLASSLREIGDAFSDAGSHRDKLVRDARERFLSPLSEFVHRDWKQICQSDKNLRDLAAKIQKIKVEAKTSQAEVNILMGEFVTKRQEVMNSFEYILKSEIPLTQRLINLVEVHKRFHEENTKVFETLEKDLRKKLKPALPKTNSNIEAPVSEDVLTGLTQSLPTLPTSRVVVADPDENRNKNATGESDSVYTCVKTSTESTLQFRQPEALRTETVEAETMTSATTLIKTILASSVPAMKPMTLAAAAAAAKTTPPMETSTSMTATKREDGSQVSGLGDGASLWLSTLIKSGGDFLTRGKCLWEAKNLAPLQGASPSRAVRSYGFCRQRYKPTTSDELDLEVAELVYIDAKLIHVDTNEIWACGERCRKGEKRVGLFPLKVIDIIIDM